MRVKLKMAVHVFTVICLAAVAFGASIQYQKNIDKNLYSVSTEDRLGNTQDPQHLNKAGIRTRTQKWEGIGTVADTEMWERGENKLRDTSERDRRVKTGRSEDDGVLHYRHGRREKRNNIQIERIKDPCPDDKHLDYVNDKFVCVPGANDNTDYSNDTSLDDRAINMFPNKCATGRRPVILGKKIKCVK